MENILPRREARENAFLLAFSQTFGDVPLQEALDTNNECGEERPVDVFGQRLYWQLPDAAVVRCDRKPHYDRDFSVLSAGDPDFDGIYARSAAKENESGAIKYRCSCIWGNAQEQRYFLYAYQSRTCTGTVGCSTPRFWMWHWGEEFIAQTAQVAGALLPVCVGRHPPSQAQ